MGIPLGAVPGILLLLFTHSNGQRPSAITGMTKQELDEGMKRRKLGDTQRAVIVVQKHKTGPSILIRTGHLIYMPTSFSNRAKGVSTVGGRWDYCTNVFTLAKSAELHLARLHFGIS